MISRTFVGLLAVLILVGGVAMAGATETPGLKLNKSMLVSSEWLAQHLQDSDLIVLCVAADRSFYEQHIPGSRFIPLNVLVSQGETLNAIPPAEQLRELFEAAGVSKTSRIVIYGDKQGMLAARAYVTLDYLGLADRAALLDGGIEKWRAENREQSNKEPKVERTHLEIRVNPLVVESLDGLKNRVSRGDATLIDARPPAEFTGEKRSDDVPSSGHIRGARGLYWMDLLTSKEIPTFRPPAELLAAYEAAGAVPNRDVITYCRTGMQASVDYFIAKYLGFPSRIYVSSFYEWSRKGGAVETSAEGGASR